MNTAQKCVVALIKSALTGQAQPLPEGFSIEEVLQSIQHHHVDAMIYEGATVCGINAKDPAIQKLFPKYCKSLQVSTRQMGEVERVCRVFEEKGIDYMPLKGCKLKALYPKPELRSMGDADILIRLEQYGEISALVKELGFDEIHETDHELIWQSGRLHLELHKCLIPPYNKDLYGYFGEGWKLAKKESGTRYAMSAEDEMIYLFTHFAKHYRDGGIGCRHLVDLWVYRMAHPDLDETFVESQLQQLQLLEFYRNILRVIAAWFENAPSDEITDFISDFIFSGGSWGNEESRRISIAVRDAKHLPGGSNAKLAVLWQALFPGIYALREKYPILKKHPKMLPLVWLWRPFYKLLFERQSLQEQQRKLNSVNNEKLADRQQALRYVGLDYNF